jgi:hypothetical protein
VCRLDGIFLLTQSRKEHYDKAAEHGDVVADPGRRKRKSSIDSFWLREKCFSSSSVLPVCERSHERVCDELHDGLGRKHDPDLDVLLGQLPVLLSLGQIGLVAGNDLLAAGSGCREFVIVEVVVVAVAVFRVVVVGDG